MTFGGMRDWLLRPVARRHCVLRELQDGTYDLADVALMNEIIDVEQENEARLRKAAEGRA